MSEDGPGNTAPASAGDDSIRGRAVRASVWSTAAYGYGEATRFVSNYVLVLLFGAEDNIAALGLIAYVNILSRGLVMFSDVGVNLSVINHARGEEDRFLRTAWSVQTIRAVLMWIVCLGLAWPYAWFYGEPLLVALVPVVGFSIVMRGMSAPGVMLAERRLWASKLALLQVVPQTAAVIVMLSWAWIEATVWALAAAVLTRELVHLTLSHLILRPAGFKFCFDREALGSILRFGAWVLLSTAFTFLATELPALTMGRWFGPEMLALFVIALTYAMMPSQVVLRLARQALFPALSAVVNRGDHLNTVLPRVQLPLRVYSGLASSLVYACGPWFMLTLYPSNVWDTAWMLHLLALIPMVRVISEGSRSVLLAMGNARATAIGQVAKLVALAALLPLGYWMYGLPGFVAGAALAEAARYLAFAVLVEESGVRVMRGDLVAVLCSAVAALLGSLTATWVAGSGELLQLDGRVLTGVAAVAGAVIPLAMGVWPSWLAYQTLRGLRR